MDRVLHVAWRLRDKEILDPHIFFKDLDVSILWLFHVIARQPGN